MYCSQDTLTLNDKSSSITFQRSILPIMKPPWANPFPQEFVTCTSIIAHKQGHLDSSIYHQSLHSLHYRIPVQISNNDRCCHKNQNNTSIKPFSFSPPPWMKTFQTFIHEAMNKIINHQTWPKSKYFHTIEAWRG